MRVLLTSNASHEPPKGGSTRSNLAWMRHMAAQGHECVAVAPGSQDAVSSHEGVRIESYKDLSLRARLLAERIHEFRPDWVLVSSEDVSHILLREAGYAASGRLVYLAHTPQFMPFGPESWHRDPVATEIIRRAQGIVVIGRHMAGYVRQHLDREAQVIHPPIYGRAPWPNLGRFEAPLVLMINPCAVKGLQVFLGLARRFPQLQFAALNGWGTTQDDRAAIAAQSNVELLGNVPEIDDVLKQARVLLMPSLWYEGFGLITMEAMLRGVPVIASDSGGLAEAKCGTGYVIPVRPVERYEAAFDDTGMPRAVVPEQEIEPWARALETLTTDRGAWEEEARRSRAAGVEFAARLDAGDFEKWLAGLTRGVQTVTDRVKALDPGQKARLAALLQARKKG